MKILFVTHRFAPHTGGIETHVREVGKQLLARGHDVTVFTADGASDRPTRVTIDGIDVCRFRALNPGMAFYFAPQMAAAVRRADVDIVHAHNYHAFPLFFASLGSSNKRFVATPHYHGSSASGFRNGLLSMYRPIGGRALRRAEPVIAVSEWEQCILTDDFSVEATHIPNGLDVSRFADAAPEPRDGPYLLCVGRLTKYKRIQDIVRALPHLPKYELVVVGTGPYREKLEVVAERTGVATRVAFEGFVDDERLPSLYAGAAAHVTLSEFEAYGMTVPEAVAAGTPCVVAEASALQDWAGRDGIFGVPHRDADTVVAAIKSAVDAGSPGWTPPTWDEVVEKLLGVYLRESIPQ